jgi:hypothetical protein
VLYKYLNPNLLALAVATPAQPSLTLYLLDNVSGRIVYESKVNGVDPSKSIEIQIVENTVYWTYYSTGDAPSQSRGTHITVAELYESANKNEKYNTYTSTNHNSNIRTEWTSFDNLYPHVIAKTYLFDHPISALSTTSTRHGITSKDLLIATPNQLIALPKRLLDPRRPVIPKYGKLKADEKEEGLVAYDPLIPDERKWTISHINEVSPSHNKEADNSFLVLWK